MEVVLLVSFPTKRKFRRLKLEVHVLPEAVMAPGDYPSMIGLLFHRTNIRLREPRSLQSSLRYSAICTHFDDFISTDILPVDHGCDGLPYSVFDTLSYRWVIPPLHAFQRQSKMHLSKAIGTSSFVPHGRHHVFECGKGGYSEDLLGCHPELIAQLDEVLFRQQTELRKIEGATLSFDDTTNFLSLDLGSGRGVWTVDTTTWDVLPSSDLEPWCVARLGTALADHKRTPQLFSDLVEHFVHSVHTQLFTLSCINHWLIFKPLLTSLQRLLDAEMNKFLKWLMIIEKYLSRPLGEVLTKPKYQALVKPEVEPFGMSFLHRPDHDLRYTRHEVFENLVDGCISQIAGIRESSDEDSKLRNYYGFYDCMKSSDTCGLVRQLRTWTQFSIRNPSIWRSLLRRLRKLAVSQHTAREVPVSTHTLKWLHSRLSSLSKKTIKQPSVELSCPLFIPDQQNRMQPVKELCGFWVLWMATSKSGLVFVHVKSRTAPYKDFVVQLLSNEPSIWCEIPSTPPSSKYEDYFWENSTERLILPNSIWILELLSHNPREFLISRVSLDEPLAHRSKPLVSSFRYLLPISCHRYLSSMTAFEDCLIVVAHWAGPEFTEHNCCVPLQYFKYQPGTSDLTAPQYLRDASPKHLLQKFHRNFGAQPGWISSKISTTSNDRRFLEFRIKQNHSKPTRDPNRQTDLVRLALFRLNLVRGEYTLIHTQNWIIPNTPGTSSDEKTQPSTFRIGSKEYFLYSLWPWRMLIAFDPNQMTMVLVDGNAFHKTPRNIGWPIELLGSAQQSAVGSFVYPQLRLGNRMEYRLVKLRYRSVQL